MCALDPETLDRPGFHPIRNPGHLPRPEFRSAKPLFTKSTSSFFLILSLVLVSFMILGLPGCITPTPTQKPPIKLSINVWPGSAYAYLAEKKGYFKKNGVVVEFVLEKDYSDQIDLFREESVDGTFIVYADLLVQNSEGVPAKVVYVADRSINGDVLIGQSNLTSLDDARGKRIGVDGINSFSHFFVLRSLEKHNISEVDVQFVNVPAYDCLNALEADRVVVCHTWDPTKSLALEKGYKILSTAGDVPGTIVEVLAINPKLVQTRPEDVLAIIKSLEEARAYLKQNRTDAILLMAQAENMSVSEMNDGVSAVYLLTLQENADAMKKSDSPESLYVSGDAISAYFIARGQMTRKPNLDQLIEPRFVNELR